MGRRRRGKQGRQIRGEGGPSELSAKKLCMTGMPLKMWNQKYNCQEAGRKKRKEEVSG